VHTTPFFDAPKVDGKPWLFTVKILYSLKKDGHEIMVEL
jgi:hypothetical protein